MKTDPRTRPERPRSPFRVVVASDAGRLRLYPPRAFRGGSEWVEAGQPVAYIERGTLRVEILAPVGGKVAAVLGLEGEPVVAGHAVFAIEPEPEDA